MRGLKKWMLATLMVGVLVMGDLHAAGSKSHIEASMTEFIGVPHSSSLASAGESVAMSVDPQTAQGIFRRAATLTLTDFPLIDGETVDLDLERQRPVVDQTTRIHSGDRVFDIPEVLTFYGTVAGDYNSRVVLNYAEGVLIGSVELSSGEKYSLSPALGQTKRANRDHVMQLSNGDDYDRHFACGQEGLPAPADEHEHNHTDHDHAHPGKGSQDKVLYDDLLEVDLAVETDSYLYDALNAAGEKEEFIINYTISLVAMISAIFQENINVTFVLSDINVFTNSADGNPDPYTAARGQLGGILAQFSQTWATGKQSVRRDIAHIMSAYPAGGGVVGVAYTGGNSYPGTLCRKNPFTGYGASGIRFNARTATLDYTGDVAVMAHELGHNFGAPHTHNCFWRARLEGAVIDTCVNEASQSASDGCISGPVQRAAGTIMSYCHNVNSTRTVSMVFHPLMRDQMRANAERASNCVDVASSPVIYVTRPYANEQYTAGQTVDIRWTSERVNSVVISYSTDGGEKFDEIATVDANDRTYEWSTPFTDTENAIVRIADVRNQNLFGESYASFTIESPSLTVQTPNGGDEIAGGSETNILWQGLLVDRVNIDFSPDNGDSWEPVATDVSGSTYEWDVPSIQTESGLIRITDASNPELFDVSDAVFSIGLPELTILSPNGGEIWPIGGERMITWESQYVRRARIEYTINDGENWSVVSPFVTASDGEYSWNIPSNADLESSQVRVRIRDLGSDDVTGVSAGVFTLSIAASVKSEAELGFSASVQPNPAVDQAQLIVRSQRTVGEFAARVVDVLGNTVLELQSLPMLPAGETRIEIDGATLAPGAYFILLQSERGYMQQPFNIVR